ncbi:type III secretion system chaperone [Nocardioides solisilvae]|uniref:type III secretion system chaperone n=1 Tax=Nocardioides solisilvae TaxID=1542435 RepID=UPI000D748F69|nr:type III secretion system chaperone [Nocardioides solisilvae]
MGEELVRRWDDAVETAWRELRQRVADRLAGMDEDMIVGLATWEEPGVATGEIVPLCDATLAGDVLRVEVNSNHYLPDDRQLDDAQQRALIALGYHPPAATDPAEGETCFWVDLERREADRAAVMLVRAVREVHGLPHPVYLETMGLEEDEAVSVSRGRGGDEGPDLHRPIFPRDVDELRAGVELAVGELYAVMPDWDEDGDLPLATAHGRVWVFVSPQRPRVLLHCWLVDEVEDTTRALLEVNMLNAREAGLTFAFREGGIAVSRELDLTALVPAVLKQELERLLSQVDQWGSDLVARLGGRRLDDDVVQPAPAGPSRRIPPRPPAQTSQYRTAYGVMLELEKQERGSVSPTTILRIFGRDQEMLLEATREVDAQVRRWKRRKRTAVEKGDTAGESLAGARIAMFRDLRHRLRQALRLTVETPQRKVPHDQLALFDEDECDHPR